MGLFNKISNSTENRITKNLNRYSTETLPVLLKKPKVLLIGGGAVAHQKARVLKLNNIDFSLISLAISDDLKSLNVDYKLRKFRSSDIKNHNIIIDATGNPDVNKSLKKLKEKKFFLLNTVDKPEDCDFYFSSLLVYKNLKIAVSSDGASPTLTQVIRNKIKEIIPERVGEFAEQKLIERSNNIINIEKTKKEIAAIFGKVWLIGCGPGDVELLTIKALRVIQSADVILYDSLVDEKILSFVKEDAKTFCVGKQKNHHKFTQDEINNVILEFARPGNIVARLKGGDPYIFGRGAEEAEFLIDNDISVEVIPGISSAFAAPLLAGIPATQRDLSSGVTVVSGYKKDGEVNIEWIDLLKMENHTVVVLMGLTAIDQILYKGIEQGVRSDLPVAIVSNASSENQKVLTSTFENISSLARNAEKPAVLVFGEVVNKHYKLFNKNLSPINNQFENETYTEIPFK